MTDAHRKSPDQLRAEIDVTRRELGDTVEQLAAQTDVGAQLHERVDGVAASVGAAVPDSAEDAAHQAGSAIRRHPIPVAATLGVLAGLLIARGFVGR